LILNAKNLVYNTSKVRIMNILFWNKSNISNLLILIIILMTSCSLESTLEDIYQGANLQESEITTETELQNSNMRLMQAESCQDYCIEPGSMIFYPVSDMAIQTVGINTKSVSYTAYNTETDFIVEVTYKITSGPANARAGISINIEGNEIKFNSVRSGSTVSHKIPLAEHWSGCNEVKFSISQKGLGQPINFNNSYLLFPVCVGYIDEPEDEIGSISQLFCGSVSYLGELREGKSPERASFTVPYDGGNGGEHEGQIVSSTGVVGLTATLSSGSFSDGSGSLVYVISGMPNNLGEAVFLLNIGGQICEVSWEIGQNLEDLYPSGTVFCASGPTEVVEVTNPVTGKVWMDRNLGATRAATSSTDAESFGDLYQWGRASDGHQCRNSKTTTVLSSTDQPGHGDFIITLSSPPDWRSPSNNRLWQGVDGINNPCPKGFRIPTGAELNAERSTWATNNSSGAFGSPLKLPLAGFRLSTTGEINVWGRYWGSSIDYALASRALNFGGTNATMDSNGKARGLSVRCIKN
jgi:uncharacterized protein (TIGR02145 family)